VPKEDTVQRPFSANAVQQYCTEPMLNWRNQAIALIDPVTGNLSVIEILRQLSLPSTHPRCILHLWCPPSSVTPMPPNGRPILLAWRLTEYHKLSARHSIALDREAANDAQYPNAHSARDASLGSDSAVGIVGPRAAPRYIHGIDWRCDRTGYADWNSRYSTLTRYWAPRLQ
jgi:hypothetical protein